MWFRGAFTYHLPSGYDSRKKLDKIHLYADKILGLDLSPETFWNLTPWSWAVDWFSNTGDVISNVQSFAKDGLVLRYGYIMEHSVHKITYTLGKSYVAYNTVSPGDVSFVTETKKRIPASPFGFGLTYSALSAQQKAIMAALGLSRRG
jgi:hypothetical protein